MAKKTATAAEKQESPEVEELRSRVNAIRRILSSYFVAKQEVVDLIVLCAFAQEPLLLVGKPGTAKSDLIVKFCECLGLEGNEYFEYMLTRFTEPSEIIGPVDINQLKDGRYIRRTGGKIPEAKIVFLDEIFKSNSAILNTLLTIINERKFYQDGQPMPVNLLMLFGATNEIPEFVELAALRDRFVLKVPSESVRDSYFEELVGRGLQNESLKTFNQRPWAGISSLDDLVQLKSYFDKTLFESGGGDIDGNGGTFSPINAYFSEELFALFKRVLRTLAKEDRVEVSDRKVVKLYKLIRARAFLFHGGVVRREDLTLLRYIPDRLPDFTPVREKVDTLLRLE